MKRRIFLFVFIAAAVGISVYFYAYKGHRDIATETADFTLTVVQLQKALGTNDSLAYKKYQDKTIQVSGKLSSIDAENKALVIDEKLFATFLKDVPKGLEAGGQITVKGRFLGYDDLLEEFKMDQATVINE